MVEAGDVGRVAVYIDFDNIVISHYDDVHGEGSWRSDKARDAKPSKSTKVGKRLDEAEIDVSAVLDYASSFGSIAISRAYADWSVAANASYRGQLVERSIDLTQLFPVAGTKNGADIRLAVDVLEDVFRLPDISHIVIVAGDSDYIALAQRCRRLGRVVVGVGVSGGTSRALISAVDEFEYYHDVVATAKDSDADEPAPEPEKSTKKKAANKSKPETQNPSAQAGTRLLIKALGLVSKDDDGWSRASAVKSQMKRLNPQFSEKAIGFSTFTDFVRSRSGQVELREDGQQRFLRLRA